LVIINLAYENLPLDENKMIQLLEAIISELKIIFGSLVGSLVLYYFIYLFVFMSVIVTLK